MMQTYQTSTWALELPAGWKAAKAKIMSHLNCALVANGVGRDVNYRCPVGAAGRDDEAVDAALSTLRFWGAVT